jgi:hypothetical protein
MLRCPLHAALLANANIMTRGALELFIDASTTVDG